MSRTSKGAKGSGYDYWSRRNYKDMTIPGTLAKTITRRAERRKARAAINKEEQ